MGKLLGKKKPKKPKKARKPRDNDAKFKKETLKLLKEIAGSLEVIVADIKRQRG